MANVGLVSVQRNSREFGRVEAQGAPACVFEFEVDVDESSGNSPRASVVLAEQADPQAPCLTALKYTIAGRVEVSGRSLEVNQGGALDTNAVALMSAVLSGDQVEYEDADFHEICLSLASMFSTYNDQGNIAIYLAVSVLQKLFYAGENESSQFALDCLLHLVLEIDRYEFPSGQEALNDIPRSFFDSRFPNFRIV